jgi:hypothetical protein
MTVTSSCPGVMMSHILRSFEVNMVISYARGHGTGIAGCRHHHTTLKLKDSTYTFSHELSQPYQDDFITMGASCRSS